MVDSNRLAIKSYPTNPDDWCETTLTPLEGQWQTIGPSGSDLEIVDLGGQAPVGQRCVMHRANTFSTLQTVRFSLNNGREFNGLSDQATIHFYMFTQPTSYPLPFGYVILYDLSGRSARREVTLPAGVFTHFSLPLGQGQGWTEDPDFDWRYISFVDFSVYRAFTNPNTIYIDELHFSYYLLEPALLTVLSDPTGKQFRYDTMITTTPYTVGLTPNVPITIWIDPNNFKQWDDGELNPTRTITLQEAEQRTLIAIYETPPPPPPPSNHTILLAGLGGITALLFIAYLYFKG